MITDKDYAEIVSTFITQTTPKYRCDDCLLKHKGDKNRQEKHFEAMACGYYADKPRHEYRGEHCNKGNPSVLYKNCIGNHYNGMWASMINYSPKYLEGILPFSGGLMDQPTKFVEVMDLVHNLVRENQQSREAQDKLRSRSKIVGKR